MLPTRRPTRRSRSAATWSAATRRCSSARTTASRPVVRGQRRQGAVRRRHQHGRDLSNCRACSATSGRHEGEGVLGRRNRAVLRQPRRPRSGRRRPGGRVRGGPEPDHHCVPEPDRPGESRQAGRPQDHEEGGAPERRRHRRAPSDPERRRGRRPPAAVPVRRGDAGPDASRSRSSSASTATCRTWSTSAQRQHARDVRGLRPGHQEVEHARSRCAGDRHRTDRWRSCSASPAHRMRAARSC